MPAVGETWVTRYGKRVRLISDAAKGPYPLVGLVEWGDAEKAWLFNAEGINCDPCDSGLDLIKREVPRRWANQPIEDILKMYERADD